MYRISNVKAISTHLNADLESQVVCDDMTSLLMQGFVESLETVRFHVSGSAFAQLTRDLPAGKIQTVNGIVVATIVSHGSSHVVIELGLPMTLMCVDGVYLIPVDAIRNKAEIVASVPSNRGWAEAKRKLSIIDEVHAKRKRELELELTQKLAIAAKNKRPRITSELTEDQLAYEARCKRADWYYSYSDDLSVYKAGKANCEELKAVADKEGGLFKTIYEFYSKR